MILEYETQHSSETEPFAFVGLDSGVTALFSFDPFQESPERVLELGESPLLDPKLSRERRRSTDHRLRTPSLELRRARVCLLTRSSKTKIRSPWKVTKMVNTHCVTSSPFSSRASPIIQVRLRIIVMLNDARTRRIIEIRAARRFLSARTAGSLFLMRMCSIWMKRAELTMRMMDIGVTMAM